MLGLQATQHSSKIKKVNSEATPIGGMTMDVVVQIGTWKGKENFMVVPLDDFDVIFENEFFKTAKVALSPHLGEMFIADEQQPYFMSNLDMAQNKADAHKGVELLSTL